MDGAGPVVTVGPIAHGGHCVARLDGQVVFVRHALPGETVRLRITERNARFLRADAVAILDPAEGRVEPPCPSAGICGGCDFQHVSPSRQRELLADVVAEQLHRLAGLDVAVDVEEVSPSLGWRTRMAWARREDAHLGLRRHRSHDVEPIAECPIAHPDLPPALAECWDGDVTAVVGSENGQLIVTDAGLPDGMADPRLGVVGSDGARRRGRGHVVERVRDRTFRVSGAGFWQVHPHAAATLVDAVGEAARVRPGDRVADLYAGVGLFSAFLAPRTGPHGTVVSVEVDPTACRDARRNLHDLPTVRLIQAPVDRALAPDGPVRDTLGEHADVVVLDPPRSGAKRAVAPIAALAPRRIVYVACDPAAMARDIASFGRHGYRLDTLRAFALFPMTHHVECVAVLRPLRSDIS